MTTESDAWAEVVAELALNDPVWQRFEYICFVSKSKGKNRRRRLWVEVELVYDKYQRTHTTFECYPFDHIASELIPQVPRDQVTEHLKNKLRGVTF